MRINGQANAYNRHSTEYTVLMSKPTPVRRQRLQVAQASSQKIRCGEMDYGDDVGTFLATPRSDAIVSKPREVLIYQTV